MEDWKEYSGKTVEEALAEALADLAVSEDKLEYEAIESESAGFLGIFKNKTVKIKARVKASDPVGAAKTFLSEVLTAMGITSQVEVNLNAETETLEVQLIGDDMAILIGKRGQTLDSLQYLVSLVVNKESDTYLKIKLDTENYRQRREETLKNLAKNIAMRVKKSHRPVTLEPMNPYERRIIHSSLQDDEYVETHSEGEEPFRKVVITPKKGVRFESRQRGKYGNGRKFGSGSGNGHRFDNNRGGYRKKNISSKEFHKKYGADTKDYSTDYKKDYADYLESKAAAKAAEAEAKKSEN